MPPDTPAQADTLEARITRGVRSAQLGLLVNAGLAIIKLIAGLLGNSYALVADAVESTGDIFSSLIVWGGLRMSARDADDDYPFGYGRAESIAAAAVGLILLGASLAVAVEAIVEIRTPHHVPAPFTLVVLVGVVAVKEVLFRKVLATGSLTGSASVTADAWHHRSDAITSMAAGVGISIALFGGDAYAAADDWAALVAAAVIALNGMTIVGPAVADLMDRAPDQRVQASLADAALAVPGVEAIEKLRIRRAGLSWHVDIHVQADPMMSLRDAHVLGGMTKSAIMRTDRRIVGVLVHMEPFESSASPDARARALPHPAARDVD